MYLTLAMFIGAVAMGYMAGMNHQPTQKAPRFPHRAGGRTVPIDCMAIRQCGKGEW